MPQYQVQSPDGRTVTLEGDSPPTESDLDEIFNSLPSVSSETAQVKDQQSLTSPENLARYAAVAGGGGFTTNPRLTSQEQLKGVAGNLGIAAALVAPELLVAAVPGLAPAAATGVVGYLSRLGLLGGVGAGAGGTVSRIPEVALGEKTFGQAAKEVGTETAIGAVATPIAGPLIQKGIQAGGAGVSELFGRQAGSIPEAVENFRRGFSRGALRPLFETSSDAKTRAAMELIESVTGQKPAQSLGEALGKTTFGRSYAQIEKELGNEAAGALSEDARNAVTKAIMHTATGLAGTGASPAQLASLTVAALQKEINQTISGPAKAAITELSESLSRSLNASLEGTGAEAFRLTTPGSRTSPFVAGNIGKMAEQEAFNAFDAAEKQLWNEYRQILGKEATAELTASAKTAEDILQGGLRAKNPDTGAIEIVGSTVQDSGTRKFLSEIQHGSTASQDIEKLRQYRAQIGRSIKDRTGFPGLENANKERLYAALSDDIDAAIEKIGDARIRTALKKASEFTRKNRTLFGFETAQGAGTEVVEGGTTGQSLFRSVLGDTDIYNTFKTVLGDQFTPFRESARDAVLSTAQKAGRTVADEAAGTFNMGAALRELESLPEEIANDLFPGTSSRLRELAVKELRTSKLLKGIPDNPDKVLDWVNVNKAELDSFLGPQGEQRFLDALRLKAAEQARYNNAILADVAKGDSGSIARDPVKFVDSILDGTFSQPGDVKAALDVVARHAPKTFHDLQVSYLSRLLEDSTVDGIISGAEIAKKIAAPVAGKSATQGGKAFDISNEILGASKVNALRTMATALTTTQKSLLGKEITARGTFLELLTAANTPVSAMAAIGGKLGSPTRSLGFYRDIINKPAQWKYQTAAKLASDPSMIPLLSKPIESLSGAESAKLVSAITSLSD